MAMTRRQVKEIRDLKIDEISLVDKGANQHATVTIAKRYGEEETAVDIYDEHGAPVDPADLDEGDMVWDDEGNQYVYTMQDEEVEEFEEEMEPEMAVAKRANPFRREVAKAAPRSSVAMNFREELSKALTDDDRDQVIAKAFGQLEEYAEIAKAAQVAAENERALRLEREYTEVAKAYNVPVDPAELGGVLMRAAEALSYEDCAVIAKCLDAAGEAVFEEYGYIGGGDNVDVMSQVDAEIDAYVSKSGNASREEAMEAYFAQNPAAYDEYLNDQAR